MKRIFWLSIMFTIAFEIGAMAGASTLSTFSTPSIPSSSINSSECASIHAAYHRHSKWKPIDSAPQDGSMIEYLETVEIVPISATMQWKGERWISSGSEIVADSCTFWRPLKASFRPTLPERRAWCRAAHMKYDRKLDRCR